ncbi:MAG: MATE family efflux transporter [Candidatus Brocadiia bacterium]
MDSQEKDTRPEKSSPEVSGPKITGGEDTREILNGSINASIWRLAVPTWGGFVFLNLMHLVDMFFVGKLGPVAVAGVTMSSVMIGIVIVVALGIEGGTTALVANAFGREDERHAGIVTGQGLFIAMVLAVALAAFGNPLAPHILRLLGAEPGVVEVGSGYLRIISGGGLALLLHISLAAALRGAGDAVTPAKTLILANALNAILDPLLIFGMFGFPKLGVAGSALATILGRGLAILALLIFMLSSRKSILELHVSDIWPRFEIIGRILRIGVFASGRAMLRNLGRLILMRLTASFGTAAVAAFGIGFRLQMLVLAPGKGFGTAAATMIGQNLGANQPGRASRSGWTATGTAMIIGGCLTALFWADPHMLIRVFNKDPEVVEAGATLLKWFSASFPLMAAGIVLSQGMIGAGESLRPMIVTGMSQVVIAVPLAVFLATRWESVDGIWVALFTGNIAMGLLNALLFQRGAWKHTGARPGKTLEVSGQS